MFAAKCRYTVQLYLLNKYLKRPVRLYKVIWQVRSALIVVQSLDLHRVPVRVSHVAIGESSKELAKPNLWILAILAKSINSSN